MFSSNDSKETDTDQTAQQSPTFQYFAAKIAGEANLKELAENARNYIRKKYPKAVPGSNAWMGMQDESKFPLTDQYFLRSLTYRCCIPPYTDQGLQQFKIKVEDYVRTLLMNNTDGKVFSPAQKC